MGDRNAGIEEKGIDLHLVEEDLRALSSHGESLLRAFHQGYALAYPKAPPACANGPARSADECDTLERNAASSERPRDPVEPRDQSVRKLLRDVGRDHAPPAPASQQAGTSTQ